MYLSVKELIEKSDELNGYAMVKRMRDIKALSRDSITVEPLTPTKYNSNANANTESTPTSDKLRSSMSSDNNTTANNNNDNTPKRSSSSLGQGEIESVEEQVRKVLEGDTSILQQPQFSIGKLKLSLKLLIEKEEKIIAGYEKLLTKER